MKDRKSISILILLIILVMIIGVVITASRGLNYSSVYTKNQRLDIYISSEFNINDIQQIANQVFGEKNAYLQTSTSNTKIVSITAESITSDEEDAVINAINEKYNITIDKSQYVQLSDNANIRGRDIVSPYIYPVLIATVVCLLYLAIRYRRIGAVKVSVIVGVLLVITQLLYLTVLAIGRVPVNRLSMPIALTIYIITMIACTIRLEHIKNKPLA